MIVESGESQARRLERLEELVWVAEAREGSAEAFARLLERYERRLLYYLRRLIPQGDAALDVHQEVWLDVYRGLKSLEVPEAFGVWVYQIAHHKAARFVRREIRVEAAVELLTEAESSERWESELDGEAVHRGLEALPVEQREVLTLHYLRDLSMQEIATVLGCPAGTVKSRLYHARKALRQVMERNRLL
jgi:RNA polymerase sigma-70 factor, ECF subfamily